MNEELKSFLKIHKNDAQEVMKLINSKFNAMHIINHKIKIIHEQNYVLFPLIDNQELIKKFTNLITKDIYYEIISKDAEINAKYKPRTLLEAVGEKIPEKFKYREKKRTGKGVPGP